MKEFESCVEASGRKWPREADLKSSVVFAIAVSHRALGQTLPERGGAMLLINDLFHGRGINHSLGKEERIKIL